MRGSDSALDIVAIAKARKLLSTPVRSRDALWQVLGAAAFAAVAALSLAAATILAPPPQGEPMKRDSNGELVSVR